MWTARVPAYRSLLDPTATACCPDRIERPTGKQRPKSNRGQHTRIQHTELSGTESWRGFRSSVHVSSYGRLQRKEGRGDDSTLSLDGFVARAFPDPQRGGPKIMIETEPGEKELPLVPHKKTYKRFTWKPENYKLK